jgi:cell division protease FtsH
VVYLLVVLAGLWLFLSFATRGPQATQLNLTKFRSEVAAGRVDTATFLERDIKITGKLQSGAEYETTFPQGFEEKLTTELLDAGVKVDSDPQKSSLVLSTLLTVILPILLLGGLLLFFMNHTQGGGSRVMAFGKAKAKLATKDQPKTTFADVAGVDEAVEDLQ